MISNIFWSPTSPGGSPPSASTPASAPAPAGALITWAPTLYQDMSGDDWSNWEMANWSNKEPFNSTWQPDNVSFNNGIMTLTLDNRGCPEDCDGWPYASGEYRTSAETYGYGYYEVRMRSAAGSGLNSSFFTYTGTWGKHDHHEIDFEFLGRNLRQVQLNSYAEGIGLHPEPMIDLDFDANQAFHNYGFRWSPESIIWYVDGVEVYRIEEDPNTSAREIPYRPGKIMTNLWTGTSSQTGWLGPFSYPGHPLMAEYDWIKYSPLSADQTPVTQPPATQPSTSQLPAPAQPGLNAPLAPVPTTPASRVIRPGLPDPRLGKIGEWGRPILNRTRVEEKVTLGQLDAVFSGLFKVPANRVLNTESYRLPAQQFDRVYPELAAVRELDNVYDNKLFWYLRDFRSYWDNSILLLSVYVQKITEDLEIDRNAALKHALEIANRFEERIRFQQMADNATRKERSPSSYSRAILSLIQAEIRSQIENQDDFFYYQGISQVESAINGLLSVQYRTDYPSKPDYYSIVKGLLVLGDLYQQRALLTNNLEYFDKAAYLYERVAALGDSPYQELSVELNDAEIMLRIEASARDIREALDFNLAEEYITPADRDLALRGIYHQLKGMALIKTASLFVARPDLRDIEQVLAQLENTMHGMIELRFAYGSLEPFPSFRFHYDPEKDEKNEFFYYQAKLIQGELLMALADRINFYSEGVISLSDYSNSLAETLELVKIYFPEDGPRFTALENELPVFDAWGLINVARDDYYDFFPPVFRYAHAQALVKLLEIAIRNATYVYDTNLTGVIVDHTYKGKILKTPDARELLQYCKDIRDYISRISEGRLRTPYLKIEFDYLEGILYLSGIARRREDNPNAFRIKLNTDTAEREIDRTVNILEGLRKFSAVENNLHQLPDPLRKYFAINITLKEAGAMLMIAQDENYKYLKSNPEILHRIRERSRVSIYEFGEKQAEIWNELVRAGYMDAQGRVADKFTALRNPNGLEINFPAAEKEEIYNILLRSQTPEGYALYLLREVEQEAAPPLPDYLWHNLTETLPRLIEEKKFTSIPKSDVPDVIEAMNVFVERNVKDYFPSQYPEIREKLDRLAAKCAERNPNAAECQAALAALIAALRPLNTPSSEFLSNTAELAVWDMNSLYAELYHMTALAYGILGKRRGSRTETKRDEITQWQYVQSAYKMSLESSSMYDNKHRPLFIREAMQLKPDEEYVHIDW